MSLDAVGVQRQVDCSAGAPDGLEACCDPNGANMRENGPLRRIRISESKDDGLTWGPVGVTEMPNPGSGLDGVRLADGHWVLIYNDSTRGRNSLAVSLSDDEGKTWKWTRHLEKHASGSYHYPAIIEGKDGTIHADLQLFRPSPGGPARAIEEHEARRVQRGRIRAGDG